MKNWKLFTVILYGVDSDGEPDVYVQHVRVDSSVVEGRPLEGNYHAAAVDAARRKTRREMGYVERFDGHAPIVYAGHLQEVGDG